MKRTGFAMVVLGLAIGSMAGGCVPYLAKAVHNDGVKGRLVDDRTNQPISKARLSIDTGVAKRHARTSADGQFEVAPTTDWYWTWAICGPVSAIPDPQELQIEAKGYMPLKINRPKQSTSAETQPAGSSPWRLEDRYILLGDLRMTPADDGHPAK